MFDCTRRYLILDRPIIQLGRLSAIGLTMRRQRKLTQVVDHGLCIDGFMHILNPLNQAPFIHGFFFNLAVLLVCHLPFDI